MMSRWLFERLKRVKQLHLVIERINEAPVNGFERAYDHLWARLERIIAESQHEKNLASIQEGLKKGPKNLAAPANQKGKKCKGDQKGGKGADKGEGGKSKDKGKGKGGGKDQGKKGGGKSKSSDGKNQSNKESGNQSSEPKGVCLFWPKGLCRRGSECPYRHEGPSGSTTLGTSASAKATPPAPAAKVKAAVALCSVIGAAGVIEPSLVSIGMGT